jgi:hypothetical protein
MSHRVTVVTSNSTGAVDWVLLVYRVPREPSTPRISIWRKLRSLGVAQVGDGVVALPEDARSRERLEWVADQVVEAGGTALLLRAQTLARKDERLLAQTMAQARAEEYRDLATRTAEIAESGGTSGEGTRALGRLRKELRDIQRRDYFPPAERDAAVAAIGHLAARIASKAPLEAASRATTADGVAHGGTS